MQYAWLIICSRDKCVYIYIVAEFNRVPKHRDKQIPEIKSNVLEVNRKLTDKISQRGQTEAFNQRNRIWASYIGRPSCLL